MQYFSDISDAFDSMTYYSVKFVNRFRSRYHRRSMAEKPYTEKRIIGERLTCRKPVSMRNEVLTDMPQCQISRKACLVTTLCQRSSLDTIP